MSDNFPLFGYRRKSYMLIGWAITSLSMCLLVFFSDLSVEAVANLNKLQNETEAAQMGGEGGDDNDVGRYLQSTGLVFGGLADTASVRDGMPPSIPFLSFALLMFGTGFWFADVMGDSIVAEKAKLEPPESRGHLQSTCYACRFFGLMIAAPLSTVIYSAFGPRSVVIMMAGLPASIIPLVYLLKKPRTFRCRAPESSAVRYGTRCAPGRYGSPWDLCICTTHCRLEMRRGNNI